MARPTANENYILVTATAPQSNSPLTALTRRISECGCTLIEARHVTLGGHLSIAILAMGSWDAVAKLESAGARMERDDGIRTQLQRTTAKGKAGDQLPYSVEVVAADRPSILFQLVEFFNQHAIAIDSLSASRFRAVQTGAEMFSAQIQIGIPSRTHLATLRDDFLEFCDELNLDAIMDPVKL